MRIRLDDIPEAARGRVLAAMQGATVKDSLQVAEAARYPRGEMNKSEMRFFDAHLRDGYERGLCLVLAQQVRIPLPGGGVYVPDFVVYNHLGALEIYEVKGGYRGPGWEQGYERFKRAAAYLVKFGIGCWLAEWKEKKWNLKRWTDE